MKIQDLPLGTHPAPVPLEHFPTRWQAFLWRNWHWLPVAEMAELLQCGKQEILAAAGELGLPPQKTNPKWRIYGYQTILRTNWHLLGYEQLLKVLGWTPEQLNYTLKEEDFLFGKLGGLKPACESLKYAPLNEAECRATAIFRERLRRNLPDPASYDYLEAPFAFADQYKGGEKPAANDVFEFNFIHSYAASCGDIFMDIETRDPVPENLLREYAAMGIKGIWMHSILFLLHPIQGAEEYSKGYRIRLGNLNKIVRRCEKHGIKLYLYWNEPRGMEPSFYEKRPDWAGVAYSERCRTNCVSRKKPLEWLEEASRAVFQAVPGLGGAFLITMSENQTHCNFNPQESGMSVLQGP